VLPATRADGVDEGAVQRVHGRRGDATLPGPDGAEARDAVLVASVLAAGPPRPPHPPARPGAPARADRCRTAAPRALAGRRPLPRRRRVRGRQRPAGPRRRRLLLRELADRLWAGTRTEDTVGRLGGDEFAVLSRASDVDGAEMLARRFQATFDRPFELAGHADLAMCAATAAGRNRVRHVSPDLPAHWRVQRRRGAGALAAPGARSAPALGRRRHGRAARPDRAADPVGPRHRGPAARYLGRRGPAPGGRRRHQCAPLHGRPARSCGTSSTRSRLRVCRPSGWSSS
jgi:hypothetical protein